MKKSEQIREYEHNNINYLYNATTKTAVLLKSIIRVTTEGFTSKKKKHYNNHFDIANRLTTTSVGNGALSHFINNDTFPGFDLVVPIGSHVHETCIFYRKRDDFFEAIYFNPNYSTKAKGTQSSNVAHVLLSKASLKRVQAFHSDCQNIKGKCSFLTWRLITNFLMNGLSPFDDSNIDLEDYNHLAATYAHNKRLKLDYSSDNDELVFHEMWKNLDDMIPDDIDDKTYLLINKLLSEIVEKYILG